MYSIHVRLYGKSSFHPTDLRINRLSQLPRAATAQKTAARRDACRRKNRMK
jgi:hypothetical protein